MLRTKKYLHALLPITYPTGEASLSSTPRTKIKTSYLTMGQPILNALALVAMILGISREIITTCTNCRRYATGGIDGHEEHRAQHSTPPQTRRHTIHHRGCHTRVRRTILQSGAFPPLPLFAQMLWLTSITGITLSIVATCTFHSPLRNRKPPCPAITKSIPGSELPAITLSSTICTNFISHACLDRDPSQLETYHVSLTTETLSSYL
jgi:hypothetical protein